MMMEKTIEYCNYSILFNNCVSEFFLYEIFAVPKRVQCYLINAIIIDQLKVFIFAKAEPIT